MRRPRVQFASTADSVRVAYWDIGEGPPLVVMPPNTLSHCQLEWEHAYFAEWYDALLKSGRRLIKYDGRGSGLSDRDAPMTFDGFVADLTAVADRVGLEAFDLWGTYSLAPAGIRYAAEHPGRVRHLVLWAPIARWNDLPPLAPNLVRLVETDWKFFTESAMRIGAEDAKDDALGREIAAFWREATGPQNVLAYVDALQRVDVTADLAGIAAPTLVIHPAHLPMPPIEVSQRIVAAVPDASLAVIEGNDLLPVLTDHRADVIDLLDDFLGPVTSTGAGVTAEPPSPAGVRAVLFTDLVDHTAMMRRLGDDAGRQVLREHERLVRDTLAAHGGAEVKTMGDGFMAWFGSVLTAVRCAVDLQVACAERNRTAEVPFELRVGLNAGEPVAEDGDLFGETVILAARVTAEAGPGEILAPDHVRHLVAGKGITFSPRGEFKPKGFDEAMPVSLVVWR